MSNIKIGIIGGTGIYKLPGVTNLEKIIVETEYGDIPVNVGNLNGKDVAFLTRHGERHSIAPGKINYRGNISAMKKLGVKQIFATACSGSVNPEYGPGSFVAIRQFIEFTKNRKSTFFDYDGSADGRRIGHIDLTEPYCDTLISVLLRAGKELGIIVKDGAAYCCMEGPRFETKAEIQMFRTLGCDLVGHTSYPEQALAREAEICYASMGIVANMAAGIDSSHVDVNEVQENMANVFEDVQSLLVKAVELTDEDRDCWCRHALDSSYA